MFFCVSLYLEKGLVELPNSDKMMRKHIKLSFGEEFLDYFENNLKTNYGNQRMLSDEWKGFLMANELDKKDYSLIRFKRAIEDSTKLFDINLVWDVNRQAGNIKCFTITFK
jgi:hypothetical protein